MTFQKIFKRRNVFFNSNNNLINKSFTTRINLNQYHTANKETLFVDSSDNIKIEVLHYPPAKQTVKKINLNFVL
jgi:hypothetical protein